MAITRDQVRHIALLARLQLNADEETAFAKQLDHILTYFQKLQQLDTENVEPTAHIVDVGTPFRDDEVRNTNRMQELLANAPARDGAFFKVPKIID
jgi:aspartyl-tRNA(Asn)/glutamyl-tRNA(Gln) amidotransferase subunit C